MADGAEKRRASATQDGAANLKGCSAGEGRVVLSPLTSFHQERRNRSPPIQFSGKRKNSKGHHSVVNATGVEHVRRPLECQNMEPNNNIIISASHIALMEDFLAFCKSKKAEQALKCNSQFADKNTFKDRIVTLYGDYLAVEVIDEICQLVHDKSVPKCKSCICPIESLVIRVLGILSEAASRKSANQNVTNNVGQNGSNAGDEDGNKSAKEIHHTPTVLLSSSDEEVPEESSHAQSKLAATGTTHPLRDCLPNVVAAGNLDNNILKNPPPVLDTPVHIIHKTLKIGASVSYTEPVDHINKRLKPTRPVKYTHPPAPKLFQDEDNHVLPAKASVKASPEIKIKGEMLFKDRCSELGKLTDQLYNQKNLPHSASKHCLNPPTANPSPPSANLVARAQSKITTHTLPRSPPAAAGKHDAAPSRFIVNDMERRYYYVLCGLAHSQWSCLTSSKPV